MSHCLRSARDVFAQALEIRRVGPRDHFGRHAGTVHRRDLGTRLVHRHAVGGVAAQRRDAGAVLAGLVVGRPVHRRALEEADLDAVSRDDRRLVRRRGVRAAAGVRDAELVERAQRRHDRLGAVVHVVRGARPRRCRRRAAPCAIAGARVEAFVATASARPAAGRSSTRDWRSARRRCASTSATFAKGASASVTFIRLMSPVNIRVVLMGSPG